MRAKIHTVLVMFLSFFVLSAAVRVEAGEATMNRQIGEITCTFVYLIEFVAAGLASLLIILAGVKYVVAGDDPAARTSAKLWIVNSFVGLIIIFSAVPVINFSTRSFTGPYSCETVPGEKMITGESARETALEREEDDPQIIESREAADVDLAYSRLLGREPVNPGAPDVQKEDMGKAASGKSAGYTFNTPDYLIFAFFLLGVSMLFTMVVTAYKMRESLKKNEPKV
jgi:hypothetical protein